MSITKTHENLLPQYGDLEIKAPSQTGPSGVDLEPDASGCFGLIGPLEACFSVSINPLKIDVALKAYGVTIVEFVVEPGKPVVIDGHYGIVYWDLDFSVVTDGAKHCLALSGKACMKWVGCKSFKDVHIVCL